MAWTPFPSVSTGLARMIPAICVFPRPERRWTWLPSPPTNCSHSRRRRSLPVRRSGCSILLACCTQYYWRTRHYWSNQYYWGTLDIIGVRNTIGLPFWRHINGQVYPILWVCTQYCWPTYSILLAYSILFAYSIIILDAINAIGVLNTIVGLRAC